jgi:hypothetical protein
MPWSGGSCDRHTAANMYLFELLCSWLSCDLTMMMFPAPASTTQVMCEVIDGRTGGAALAHRWHCPGSQVAPLYKCRWPALLYKCRWPALLYKCRWPALEGGLASAPQSQMFHACFFVCAMMLSTCAARVLRPVRVRTRGRSL